MLHDENADSLNTLVNQTGFEHSESAWDDPYCWDAAVSTGETLSMEPALSPISAQMNSCSFICSSGDLVREQRLPSLVADMHRQLRTLETGPWQDDGTRTLDDYPVGTILNLSKEFSNISVCIFNEARAPKHVTASNPTEEGNAEIARSLLEGTSAETEQPDVDTVTALLLLSGYLTLVRMFEVVLDHFKRHLTSLQSVSCDRSNAAFGIDSKTQLCQLPGFEFSQIHTAIEVLVAVFEEIEESLGQGGSVGKELVMTRLLQDGWLEAPGTEKSQCSFSGLSGKFESVKVLLKAKMGF